MRRNVRERRRLSFGPAAELYDRARPSYPPGVVAWILGDTPRRVLDVGAGTGMFSRLLASLGHEVIAVEPDDGMRATLTANSPGVTALAGSAESIPVPDGSVHAVVAAQAYHWFANDAAHREFARVIEPGGVVATVWNDRDQSVAWVAELSRVAELENRSWAWRGRMARSFRRRLAGGDHDPPDFGPLFSRAQLIELANPVEYTVESLVELIRSRSRYIVAGEAQRARMDKGVRALVEGSPQPFELPYITRVSRAAKL